VLLFSLGGPDPLETVVDEASECLPDMTVERGEIPPVGLGYELDHERSLEVVYRRSGFTQWTLLRSGSVDFIVNSSCPVD